MHVDDNRSFLLSLSSSTPLQDTTAPVLSFIEPTLTATCDALPALPAVALFDECDASPVLTTSQLRVNGSCVGNYSLVRTFTARDACGLTATATQTVVVTVGVLFCRTQVL